MSTASADRLYDLLPAIYRMRDQAEGQPLRALLQVIAEQVDLVENDIAQLYENWFIETCDDWVVPYIAALVGYRPVYEAGQPGAIDGPQSARRNAILIPRREVAHTIHARRRKGTLALLELLSGDVAGWSARAVEFFRLLSLSQPLNRPQLASRSVDLRHGDALERIDGAFDELAHTIDLRRLQSQRTHGRWSVPAVGLFVWRLRPYSITEAPAYCIDRVRHQYTFSILGNNTPLFTLPEREPSPTHIADELNVPAPIRRRAMEERTADYYGPGKSLQIWRDSLSQPVPLDQIVTTDLSDWSYRPQGNQVAVDPVLGRIAFAPRTLPKTGVWVSYHYGLSADLGGGEYERPLRSADGFKRDNGSGPSERPDEPPRGRWRFQVGARGDFATINQALLRWWVRKPADAIIEITDSGAYVEQIAITLAAGQRLELRAANGTRPVIRLLDFYTNRPDALRIEGPEQGNPTEDDGCAQLELDGLLIAGRSVQIGGQIDRLTIRHCTFVPGWSLDQNCEPENENEPSLELVNTSTTLQIEHSIVGTIQVSQDEVLSDPIRIMISDSVLDATRRDLEALGALGYPVAHAVLTIVRSTVIGRIDTHAIELAENTIFDGEIHVARRQHGCIRFCYVTPGSRTPRRYNCQPDLVERAVLESPPPAPETVAAVQQRERTRVRPQFNSTRYGTPTYCQLSAACAPEITGGADDEAEMGVFHDLFQPQRLANLRARLEEYSPAGMDAGIILVN